MDLVKCFYKYGELTNSNSGTYDFILIAVSC